MRWSQKSAVPDSQVLWIHLTSGVAVLDIRLSKESLLAFRCASHEETDGDGVLLDLSKGGCRITSEVPLALSHYYRLVLQATTGSPVTIETAVVCWRSKSMYGLKFITVGGDQEELLEQKLL